MLHKTCIAWQYVGLCCVCVFLYMGLVVFHNVVCEVGGS